MNNTWRWRTTLYLQLTGLYWALKVLLKVRSRVDVLSAIKYHLKKGQKYVIASYGSCPRGMISLGEDPEIKPSLTSMWYIRICVRQDDPLELRPGTKTCLGWDGDVFDEVTFEYRVEAERDFFPKGTGTVLENSRWRQWHMEEAFTLHVGIPLRALHLLTCALCVLLWVAVTHFQFPPQLWFK